MLQSHTSTFNAEPYFQTVNRNFHSQFEYGSAINVWWDISMYSYVSCPGCRNEFEHATSVKSE